MKLQITFVAAFLLLFMPVLVFGFQGEDEVEPTTMQYIALCANIGFIGAVVQLVKWRLLPILRVRAPYAIPLIAMALGMAYAWVLEMTGIDILPIANIFETGVITGALTSTGFAVVKEFDNKVLKA